MFKWIIHLFYRKKVRRIETMSKALQLIGKGELHVAGQLIQEVRPTEFLDDLALYYFVRGRYHLECLEFEAAEMHFHTAFLLGFRRPALFLALGLAKARLRRLGDAYELLKLAQARSTEEEEQKIAIALLQLLEEIRSGKVRRQLDEITAAAGQRVLGRKIACNQWRPADWKRVLDTLVFIDNAPMEPTEEMVVILGQWLLQKYHGVWEFGLEPSDLAVRISDVAFSPLILLRSWRMGTLSREDIEQLPLAAAGSQLFSEMSAV